MNYGYHMMNGNNWGWGLGMLFVWLLFLIFIAVVVIHLLRSHEHNHHAGHHRITNPLDIAKERYAKGDINKEQFEQLKNDLK